VSQPLAPDSLTGKTALVTGSSRGIGADTVRYLAQAGANVVINFRNKAPRAEKLAAEVRELGVEALVIGADLTDPGSVAAMLEAVKEEFGSLDILVLNASGGMESNMGEDYALRLNRDAQVSVLETALPVLRRGARVVFVTSHQAHFIRTTPTMPEYEPVALSKRAGEDALRERIPALERRGVEFVVVSGDMIEGTITATLLERANPGAIASRREEAGKLYNVSEFAAEVAKAAVEPVPADNERILGDTSGFGGVAKRPPRHRAAPPDPPPRFRVTRKERSGWLRCACGDASLPSKRTGDSATSSSGTSRRPLPSRMPQAAAVRSVEETRRDTRS
jgi:NAD(P)-dependent dehydrogenase (short-subunit alcohol dehydrogenase family)